MPRTASRTHRRASRRPWILATGLAVTGVLVGGLLNAGAATAHPAGSKGAPPLPTVGEYDHVAAPAPTGAVAAQAAAKDAANARRSGVMHADSAAAATSKTLGVRYQIQQTGYWCGPTTLAIILGYRGHGWSGSDYAQQQSAANLLGTTTNGTNWYGSDNVPSYPGTSWYPVQDALNYRLYQAGVSFRYAVHALPDSPSSSNQSTYKSNLVADVTAGYPFAVNEYAAPGYQIGKQPSGQWIMHWFAANGYSSSGATTVFADPGWGAGSASTATSTKVVVAAGGRGYIA